jgi:hypothetical protein
MHFDLGSNDAEESRIEMREAPRVQDTRIESHVFDILRRWAFLPERARVNIFFEFFSGIYEKRRLMNHRDSFKHTKCLE